MARLLAPGLSASMEPVAEASRPDFAEGACETAGGPPSLHIEVNAQNGKREQERKSLGNKSLLFAMQHR